MNALSQEWVKSLVQFCVGEAEERFKAHVDGVLDAQEVQRKSKATCLFNEGTMHSQFQDDKALVGIRRLEQKVSAMKVSHDKVISEMKKLHAKVLSDMSDLRKSIMPFDPTSKPTTADYDEVPSIKLTLDKGDAELLRNMDHTSRMKYVEQLKTEGFPFSCVRTLDVDEKQDKAYMYLDCHEGFEKIMSPEFRSTFITLSNLRFNPMTTRIDHDQICVHVILKDTQRMDMFQPTAENIAKWKEELHFKFKGAEKRNRKLIFKFDSPKDAKKACEGFFFFENTVAYGVPIDIRALEQ